MDSGQESGVDSGVASAYRHTRRDETSGYARQVLCPVSFLSRAAPNGGE